MLLIGIIKNKAPYCPGRTPPHESGASADKTEFNMTLPPQQVKLLTARKHYSECARIVETQIHAAGSLSERLSERVVGLGIAADWVRRAAEMNAIHFIGEQLNKSERKSAFTDLVRYGFAWFGLNAIFARSSLLHLVGTPSKNSEFERFKVLFQSAGIQPGVISTRENALRAILLQQTAPRMPVMPSGTNVTTLQAINAKYVPAEARTSGKGKAIDSAAQTGDVSGLDLPMLLYVFRNWSVHGNALDGSFGGRPKFKEYLEILSESLAEVHVGTAELLRQRL